MVIGQLGRGVPWSDSESYPGFGSDEKKCLKIKNKYSVQKRKKDQPINTLKDIKRPCISKITYLYAKNEN